MQAKRIDHIAIAVQDLDDAVETYENNFGLSIVKQGDVPALGIRSAFLQIGDAQIELITPLTAQGPVADFLTKQGGGMYLLSLAVDDLDAAIAELHNKGAGVRVAEAEGGKRIAFVSPRATHGVLLQLFQG